MASLEGEAQSVLPLPAMTWIHQRAAGNPLFTLEFFRFLARTGHLWSDGTRWYWREPEAERLPVSVEALIERQLRDASRDEEPRRALETLALMPPHTDPQILEQVAGLTAAAWTRALTRLEQSGLIREGAFGHPLYREVRRSTLRPARIQALARRIVELYRSQPSLATGFILAAGYDPATTLHLLMAAAADTADDVQQAHVLALAVPYAAPQEQAELALQAAAGLRHSSPDEAIRLARLALHSGRHRTETGLLLGE
ncbi:hypothetical protein [Deinococcus ruber]|uniref:Uncharacterized protein n=1 Tax=Deinococcus ruber TaxID=1848197 RepID=A0A918KWX6_9DEIO|nr:hypothetical protein [Deinococcus ruber]GGR38459.1 hypothetical protein GCM10008957_54480 [Deinococcus ruber]